MGKAPQLIKEIVCNAADSQDTTLANELLREFHRGYPVENLRGLLRHEDEQVVKTGIWILSELGRKGRSLFYEAYALLTHPSRYVRFFAVDSMLTCATEAEPDALGMVVSMLEDVDGVVRRKVLDFLYRASVDQLQGALRYHEKLQAESTHVIGLRWLVSGGLNQHELVSLLKSEKPLVRKYVVVSAARTNALSQVLRVASVSDDEDVSRFAIDRLGQTNGDSPA
jgi:hypothetical protein